ncbi:MULTISPECIES: hypothetical protein [unclassified Paenibacillus]|uniref:hypothetical protein n=1 Tax=unclassified Paenibacillus TaxID=185978 RepID=UPI002780582F|nr:MULTISPECIES: hypothetical protein [unclassified Paenibacillus]MDQ0903784.1 hypothetical protein [Paenibacillus sp. V4I7]MDQ0917742.1 hypothetical protein [Paenibacillus sp. V4I5]
MTDKNITEQTAFETAGIPTPSDQENIAATDKISEMVKGIMDNIEHAFYPEADGNQE